MAYLKYSKEFICDSTSLAIISKGATSKKSLLFVWKLELDQLLLSQFAFWSLDILLKLLDFLK